MPRGVYDRLKVGQLKDQKRAAFSKKMSKTMRARWAAKRAAEQDSGLIVSTEPMSVREYPIHNKISTMRSMGAFPSGLSGLSIEGKLLVLDRIVNAAKEFGLSSKRFEQKWKRILTRPIDNRSEDGITASDEAVTYVSGAQRSEIAPAYSLIPVNVLRRFAQRYGLGKQNYGEFNYLKACNDREFILGVFDHIEEHFQHFKVEGTATEDHLAAIMWGAATLMLFEENNPELLRLINGPREDAIQAGLKGTKSKQKK